LTGQPHYLADEPSRTESVTVASFSNPYNSVGSESDMHALVERSDTYYITSTDKFKDIHTQSIKAIVFKTCPTFDSTNENCVMTSIDSILDEPATGAQPTYSLS